MTTDLSRLSDGTYGRELGRISPEGNIYGTTRWVRDVLRNFWWNGSDWLEIGEDIGQSNSVQLLPTTPQEPDTVWRCLDRYEEEKSRYVWKYFFFDAESQSWQPILWHWTVDSVQELPNNPWFRGQAHEVKEPDVQAMWDGYTWRRIRISSLEDDLGIVSTLDMYGGTLRGLSPEVELIYISPVELTVKPINSDFEYVTVNSIVVDSSKRTSVYSFSPVLDWWEETETFSMSLLQHSTNESPEEYWVYLANKNDCFNKATYDFRGRLFCSKTSPSNSRLGKFGTDAYNAVLIGRCQTAVPDNVSDRVEFLYELNVSLVSKAADLKETFREFSDFDLVYVNETTLRLKRTYGTMGQIFVAGALYYLGESIDLDVTDTRISVDGNGLLDFDSTAIATNTIYYVYIASNSDIFNDNEINTAYNRPWHPEDEDAGDGVTGNYKYSKDLRLRLFLSTKVPEEGRLAETWRGFWARHIGQVRTDGVKKFIFSSGISSIRQATLNPTFFDGLAEITFQHISDSEFRIIKTRGTSGICIVGGIGVQTYDTSSLVVHKVQKTDNVYTYTESNYSNPLTASGLKIQQYTTTPVYIYLANNNPCWGSLAGRTFASLRVPSDAYLSQNFPGNNARWLCTLDVSSSGTFLGSYITEGINIGGLEIDDTAISANKVWSSLNTVQYVTAKVAEVSAALSFEQQKEAGLPVILEFVNANTIRLRSSFTEDVMVVCGSGLSTYTVSLNGTSATVAGNPNNLYYVWLSSSGLSVDTNAPTYTFTKLKVYGTSKVLVGYIAFTPNGSMGGTWNVYSLYNQPTQSWSVPITHAGTTLFSIPGLVSVPGKVIASRDGSSYMTAMSYGLSMNFGPTYSIVSSTTGYATGVSGRYVIVDGYDVCYCTINPCHTSYMDVTSSVGFGIINQGWVINQIELNHRYGILTAATRGNHSSGTCSIGTTITAAGASGNLILIRSGGFA